MGLKERLVQSQKEAGLSNYKLAQILGISKSTIANYQSGATTPPGPYLDAIAKILGIDREWLATGEGNKLIIKENPNSESIDVYSRLRELEARCNRYEEVIDTLTASVKLITKVETVNLKQLFHDRDDKLDKMIKELEEKLLNYLRKDEKD